MRFLNINALDDLDPVHYRAHRNPEREFDYDGDMGREHEDYCRDNNIGGGSSSIGSFRHAARALPVIEAPSIVAEFPDTAEATVAYLAAKETDNGTG